MSTVRVENSAKSQRIEYLDLFRSFGIILMVMGHVAFGKQFDFFIHAFHMPMFYWISGFLYKPLTGVPFKQYAFRKVKTLLVPYLFFGIAHYLIELTLNIIQNEPVDVVPLMNLFWVNTQRLAICEAIWFLSSLFLTYMIVFLIDKTVKNKVLKAFIVVVLSLFGNYTGTVLPFTLPFALSSALVGTGLFYIGVLFRKYMKSAPVVYLLEMPWKRIVVFAIISGVLIHLNGYVNMRSEVYSIPVLFWVNAIMATVVGYNIAKMIYPHIKDSFIGDWMTQIGKDSIVYLCLNQIVILVAGALVKPLGLHILIRQIIVLCLTLLALYYLDRLFMNTRLKVFLGK